MSSLRAVELVQNFADSAELRVRLQVLGIALLSVLDQLVIQDHASVDPSEGAGDLLGGGVLNRWTEDRDRLDVLWLLRELLEDLLEGVLVLLELVGQFAEGDLPVVLLQFDDDVLPGSRPVPNVYAAPLLFVAELGVDVIELLGH